MLKCVTDGHFPNLLGSLHRPPTSCCWPSDLVNGIGSFGFYFFLTTNVLTDLIETLLHKVMRENFLSTCFLPGMSSMFFVLWVPPCYLPFYSLGGCHLFFLLSGNELHFAFRQGKVKNGIHRPPKSSVCPLQGYGTCREGKK